MTVARRLQAGSRFVLPTTAPQHAGRLARVTSRSYQVPAGGEPFVAIQFALVDEPGIQGSITFAPHTEIDEVPALH